MLLRCGRRTVRNRHLIDLLGKPDVRAHAAQHALQYTSVKQQHDGTEVTPQAPAVTGLASTSTVATTRRPVRSRARSASTGYRAREVLPPSRTNASRTGFSLPATRCR